MRSYYIIRKSSYGINIQECPDVEFTYNSLIDDSAEYVIEGNVLSIEDISNAMMNIMANKLSLAIKEKRITIEELHTLIGE